MEGDDECGQNTESPCSPERVVPGPVGKFQDALVSVNYESKSLIFSHSTHQLFLRIRRALCGL